MWHSMKEILTQHLLIKRDCKDLQPKNNFFNLRNFRMCNFVKAVKKIFNEKISYQSANGNQNKIL